MSWATRAPGLTADQLQLMVAFLPILEAVTWSKRTLVQDMEIWAGICVYKKIDRSAKKK